MTNYPLYRAAGSHRELGRAHGEQARPHIVAHLDYLASSMSFTPAEIRVRAQRFLPLFEQHCPHLIDELKGLAEGANIDFADALAVNIRGALKGVADSGCTAFAVRAADTADNGVLIGQNSDTVPSTLEFGYVLHLEPDNKPALLMWTFGGMIGYHGINSLGVAHFANDLGGGPSTRFAMPHYPLKRLMLECRRLDEIVALFRSVPLWACGNYVLCDADGAIADIEATPTGFEVLRETEHGKVVHANHFLGQSHANKPNHAASAPDSFTRQARMEALFAGHAGKFTVADVQRFLRDRDGAPAAICRSQQTPDTDDWQYSGITVASIVAEPAHGRLHIAKGNSPDAPFTTYTL